MSEINNIEPLNEMELLNGTIEKFKKNISILDESIEECKNLSARKVDKLFGLSEIHKKDIEFMTETKKEYEMIIKWLEELAVYRRTYPFGIVKQERCEYKHLE